MSDKQERRNWTREETTLALALYLRTPTSQITVTNPNVLMWAKAINRSAASVKMKLFNLASHDVRLRDKHLDSLKHGNRMDEEVWNDSSTKARRKKDESDTEEECGTSTVSLKRPRRSSK